MKICPLCGGEYDQTISGLSSHRCIAELAKQIKQLQVAIRILAAEKLRDERGKDCRHIENLEDIRDKGKISCQSNPDGECDFDMCPQPLDEEPYRSGRRCPLK